MILKLNAIDTLFFGSGKPFTMEETSMTDSIFPPTPETIFSFLRSCYFKTNMKDYSVFLKRIIDKSITDPTINLKLNDCGLLMEDENKIERIFPIPQDLMDDKSNNSIRCLKLKKTDELIISNYPENFKYKLTYEGDHKIRDFDAATYITGLDMINYFNCNYEDIKPVDLKKLIQIEPKIGIRRNRNDLDDKLLYRLNMHRLQSKGHEISLYVDFDGINFNIDINRLGGEGKLVFINKMDLENKINNRSGIEKDQICRMYLASPMILKNDFSDIMKDQAELLTGVVGKKLFIGGWDAAMNKPKPTIKAIPAGSVFYFKALIKIDSFPAHVGENTEKGYGKVYFSKINSNI
ncbi:MAG: type III-B CRISPR module-associated protein Cmr3 [Deltaproteobacteria bacterium]